MWTFMLKRISKSRRLSKCLSLTLTNDSNYDDEGDIITLCDLKKFHTWSCIKLLQTKTLKNNELYLACVEEYWYLVSRYVFVHICPSILQKRQTKQSTKQ